MAEKFHENRTYRKKDMKIKMIHNGGQGDRHIGHYCHVTKILVLNMYNLYTLIASFDLNQSFMELNIDLCISLT